MEAFEKDVFNFFTKPENFETAFEVHQQFSWVKKELVRQFWESVKEKLEKVAKEDWNVELEDPFKPYSKLGLWVPNANPGIGVIYENLNGKVYYGLLIHSSNVYPRVKIDEEIREKESIAPLRPSPGNQWWAAKGPVPKGDDFSTLETQKMILPASRDKYAEDYANALWELAQQWGKDMWRWASKE